MHYRMKKFAIAADSFTLLAIKIPPINKPIAKINCHVAVSKIVVLPKAINKITPDTAITLPMPMRILAIRFCFCVEWFFFMYINSNRVSAGRPGA